jgi:hypothetical protein
MAIIEDPAGFFANVGEALVGGIKKFTGNFVTHLKQAFISWLTGAMGSIEMPEQFDLMGVLSIARQVLGLTWDYLKEKAAELIGEENVERLEWLIEQIRTLIEGGWGALLAKIKDQLTGLKDQIFDKIKEFILVSVVKKAVVKLASMFSPVGAVVQLVMTLWDVFQTLREQLSQIFEVVKTVVDALDKIVKGTLEPAQKKVEEVLAGVLPVAIGLLARLVGLGGLGKKVEEFIESVQERVDKAITKLLKKIKSKIKKLFGKGEKGKEDGEEEGAEGVPAALSQKRAFQAGGETHHLWVEKRRGKLVPVVASKEQTVEESVDNAPDEKKDDAAEADTVLGRLERELKRFEDDDRRGNLDEVDKLEGELAEELAPLLAGTRDWTEDVLVEANSGFLSPAHSKAKKPLTVGLEALAAAKSTTEEDIEKWKSMDEDTYKTAVSGRVESGQKGVKVPLLWEKPLKKESYNTEWAEHAEDALAAQPLARRLESSDDIESEDAPDPERFVQGQKANLHTNNGEFERARDRIAGVAFVAGRASSASQIVADELLAQLLEADIVSQDLKGVVTASTVVEFLTSLIEGRSYEGIDWTRFEELWERTPDRNHIKDAFRKAWPKQHEWLPVSEIRDVVELSADKEDVELAVEWLRFQHEARTPTDEIMIVEFEFSFDPETYRAGDAEEALEDASVEGPDDLAIHAGGQSSDLLAELEQHQKSFHDVLRAFFLETKADGPSAYAQKLLDNLDKLLWEPPDDGRAGLVKSGIPMALISKQAGYFARAKSTLETWID